jgi:BolA family transcriptional regulator, general stress-responsive regulator
MGPIATIIESKLQEAFSPSFLEVIDESHHHQGHAGANPAGESHFRLRISAPSFAGKGRVEQHRMVNAVLAQELKSRVHALAIEVV